MGYERFKKTSRRQNKSDKKRKKRGEIQDWSGERGSDRNPTPSCLSFQRVGGSAAGHSALARNRTPRP